MRAIALSGLLCTALLFACSLKYGENTRDASSEVPEFVFTDVKMQRVESGLVKVALSAAKLEQYSGGAQSGELHSSKCYGEDVKFATMSDGETTAEGQCRLLACDTDKDEYLLFGGITLSNKARAATITAESLKWDGGNELLSSGKDGTLTIQKDGTVIHGKAFYASGQSSAFAFDGAVSGKMETEQ